MNLRATATGNYSTAFTAYVVDPASGQTVWRCRHAHRHHDTALACAKKELRRRNRLKVVA